MTKKKISWMLLEEITKVSIMMLSFILIILAIVWITTPNGIEQIDNRVIHQPLGQYKVIDGDK